MARKQAPKAFPDGHTSSAPYRVPETRHFIIESQSLPKANLAGAAAGGGPSAVRRGSGVRVVESETRGRTHTAKTEAVDEKRLKTAVAK